MTEPSSAGWDKGSKILEYCIILPHCQSMSIPHRKETLDGQLSISSAELNNRDKEAANLRSGVRDVGRDWPVEQQVRSAGRYA